jgi:hypothetical protein
MINYIVFLKYFPIILVFEKMCADDVVSSTLGMKELSISLFIIQMDMDYQVQLPSIRPYDGPAMYYNEPSSYSTRPKPMDHEPQEYYQSWVHNVRPPSTDMRFNMSYPQAAPRWVILMLVSTISSGFLLHTLYKCAQYSRQS